ncbi:hypothetical protein PILCRDRAFT_813723 [Piloderma croceum F 1598]|uniref:Uncharacterized protein n=1 Tax=Piloderma croceum (strain F 1598) TaxID=765440 RepID=A0A0C3CG67_PILCF|nr:hypothetical protein PILCRDRAFT_813723 [Piloderma croceum F 1598]
MAASTFGKTRTGVARVPCGYDRLFSSLNTLDLLPNSPTPSHTAHVPFRPLSSRTAAC